MELYEGKIKFVGEFFEKEFYLGELKGYDLYYYRNRRYLLLSKKHLKGSSFSTYFCYENPDEITKWLSEKLPNVTEVEREESLKEAENDPKLGNNKEERIEPLRWAKINAFVLNTLGVVIPVWALFYPHPYNFVMTLLIVLPIVALGFVVFSNGRLRIAEKTTSVYPSLFAVFVIPPVVLTMRSFIDWNLIFSIQSIMPLVFVWVISVLGIVFLQVKKGHPNGLILPIVFTSIFIYGTFVFLNCAFDNSVPIESQTQVVGRNIERGKNTSCHITVSPFPKRESMRVRIPRNEFESTKIGDERIVKFHHGLFGLNWFLLK